MFFKVRHIHFVGIGGIGMSGIAEVLLNLGYQVSGSDLKDGPVIRRLQSLGAEVHLGHQASHIGGAHVVVVTSAARPENPEVQAALARGIPVIPRAEMLAELMRMKSGLAVAGAHGKTTTTSMLATVLTKVGLDPTVVIGGRLSSLGSNAKLGQGQFMVVEADESDGSFLLLSPTMAIVTNIDPEHLDHYGTVEKIREAFLAFINKVPFYGAAVVCLDNEHIRRLLPAVKKRLITYGLSHQADYRPGEVEFRGTRSHFTVFSGGSRLGEIRLAMPGLHNVLNATAVVALCLDLGLSFQQVAEALEGFTGVGRRFELKGESQGVLVVDDYGHHPSEILATLGAARTGFGERRIVVAFQPHRFTRTRDLLEEFTGAFHQADVVLMTDIYPAGEIPIPGVSAEDLCHRVRATGHRQTWHVGKVEGASQWLQEFSQQGDLVITLGAGDIWKAGETFLRARGAEVLAPQG